MSENKEFDKALKERLGDAIEYLDCPIHKIRYSTCPECSEAICKECLEQFLKMKTKQYKNKCILVKIGLTEVKPYKIINPKILINNNEKTIKLDYPTGEVLFNGGSLWREYKIKCNEKNIIFGVVNSIGDRMSYWAKENHYIAIDKKNKIILGLLKREMGWSGSFGQKYSDWKNEILEQNKEVKK